MAPRGTPPLRYEREVTDVTAGNRAIIERVLFAGLCRAQCSEHARYRVDAFVMKKVGRKTVAQLEMCCWGDDDTIAFLIDATPDMARRHGDVIFERTGARKGAGYDLSEFVAMGLWRRLRGKGVTLESTMRFVGDQRLSDAQSERFRAVLGEAPATGRLSCAVHGKAIVGCHIVQTPDATTVNLAVCCVRGGRDSFAVDQLVDQALLEGPVVNISVGKWAKKRPKL
jgi:hypothetical protein